MKRLLSVGMVAVLAATAFGQVAEVEPNDSFATAQMLPPDFFSGYGAGAVEGYLGALDVDFYTVFLPADTLVTASIFDYTPDLPIDNDSILGVFDPGGAIFDEDDDDGPGRLSSIHFFPPVSGMWGFAVSGFGDAGAYVGDHEEEFQYRLVLSIPEPATIGLLLLGLGLIRRR